MRRFWILPLASAITLGLLLQVPQLLHQLDPRAEGMMVQLNSDETVYMARVGEALQGRGEQSAEAFVGDPSIKGTQPALLERAVGTIFRFTGWRAPTVLQFMDFVVGCGFFLVLFLFLLQCGFSKWQAYSGTVLFSLLELYNLNRPIHQGLSVLMILLALNLLLLGVRRNFWFGILGGFLLGLLVGVYFWTWTFVWMWWGLFCLWHLRSFHKSQSDADRRTLFRMIIFTAIAALVAFPFVWELLSLSQHPLWDEAVFRSGMHPSRLPESWAYSILFVAMGAAVFVNRRSIPKHYRPAIVTIFTVVIVIHQHLIHGQLFNFVSHYLFGMIIAAISVLLLGWTFRKRALLVGSIAACIYLLAIGYDGRHVISQFRVNAARFEEQHLASALPLLDSLPRSTILADRSTSFFIASHTQHDVVWHAYLKNVLLSHQDIAARYCMTQIPLPPEERSIVEEPQLIYPDANGAFKDPAIRSAEVAMVVEACERIEKDPTSAMQRYNVDYVLWDQEHSPNWDAKRFKVPLKEVGRGDGWVVLEVQ